MNLPCLGVRECQPNKYGVCIALTKASCPARMADPGVAEQVGSWVGLHTVSSIPPPPSAMHLWLHFFETLKEVFKAEGVNTALAWKKAPEEY